MENVTKQVRVEKGGQPLEWSDIQRLWEHERRQQPATAFPAHRVQRGTVVVRIGQRQHPRPDRPGQQFPRDGRLAGVHRMDLKNNESPVLAHAAVQLVTF